MKLAIDISEDIYKKCQTSEYAKKSIYFDLVDAIRKGTILPKGHGRLIDANNITFSCFFDAGDYARARRGIYEAPTIIEADKEND